MIGFSIKTDTRAFDKALNEYLKYSKKSIDEMVATKAYYVARNAVNLTEAEEPSKVEAELRAASRINPQISLATVLAVKSQPNAIMRERYSKRTGKRLKNDAAGLQREKITQAAEKIIKIRRSSVNFLRSGWIAAIREIEKYVPKKGGPAYQKKKTFGVTKGGGKAIKGNWKASGEIWNSVLGGIKKHGLNKRNDPPKVQGIISVGLSKAVKKEMASMREYIQKKIDANNKRFNRG